MDQVTSAAFDRTMPVLAFNATEFPFHHGILGIIRSLGSLGIPLYGVFEDRFVPTAFSRYLSGKFIWSPDENAEGDLLRGLHAIAERIGRPALLIPTSDLAAIFIAEHATQLQAWYRFPQQRAELARALADKKRLNEICESAGVHSPQSFFPSSLIEAEALAAGLTFPVVVKIIEPWRRPRPAELASATIVSNAGQLIRLFCIAERPPKTSLMIQEYIPALGNVDAMFAGYCDRNSRCLVSLTGEKLRAYPAHAGMTSASRTTDDRELRRIAEEFLAQIRFRGIVDLEFRKDSRDGRYKLLDFNPRIGAQFRLYRNSAGIDVVRAMHLDLTGHPVPQGQPVIRSFIVENHELRVLWSYRRTSQLRFRDWLRSLRGEREFAWFSIRDPLPFVAMWLRLALVYAWRRLRRSERIPKKRGGVPQYHERRPWFGFQYLGASGKTEPVTGRVE